jgi:chromosome partitioning protein
MIITVGSTKGGVGKSTTAINLAVEAAKDKKRVLLVDTDPQKTAISFRNERATNDIKVIALVTSTIHEDISAYLPAFDIIIIDAGGRDNSVFRSALAACELFVLPVLPSQADIWGMDDTVKAFKEIRPFNKMTGVILLNQVQQNTKVSSGAMEALEGYKDFLPLLPQQLHLRVAYKESLSTGQGVSELDPRGGAAEEMGELYRALVEVYKGISKK